MRLVFFGTPNFAVPSLKRLLAEADFEVLAVVTQPDKRRGRGKQLLPSPVKQVALEANCPVFQPRRIKKDEETLAALASLRADAFIVVAYGQILSQRILEMPRLGCINGHGSRLPAYRGAAPIQWCLVNGDSETGMTTMQMDAGMDTGPMLLKSQLFIGLLENFDDVAPKLADQSAELLVETLKGLEADTITPEPQDDSQATYAPLIQKTDYELDWSQPAIALHNRVRGFYPNCLTHFRGQPLKVTATIPLGPGYWALMPTQLAADLQAKVQALSPAEGTQPGTVIGLIKGYGPVIQTGAGWLLLQEVKPSGKQVQRGGDFVNGSRLQVGETFEFVTATDKLS
jgi:methionyl-tRNA formyltransferase